MIIDIPPRVSLPEGFVATKYPGYFWNVYEQWLYSMKIDGVLKPLKFLEANRFNHMGRYKSYEGWKGGWRVSVNGRNRYLFLAQLEKLTLTESIIPVREYEKASGF